MSIIDTIKGLEVDFNRRVEVFNNTRVKVSNYYYSDQGNVYLRVGQVNGLRLVVISNIDSKDKRKGWMTNSVLAPIKQYLNDNYPEGAYLEFENVINKWLFERLTNKGYQPIPENCLSLRILVDIDTIL